MKVTLLHNTPLYINAVGARTCWDSKNKHDTILHDDWGERLQENEIVCGNLDKELIDRVGNKFKHQSILEHVSYNFYIEGISRACLQELARHRMTSLSVKSTRYTLKELKEEYFTIPKTYYENWNTIEKYCVLTGNLDVDIMIARTLKNLSSLLESGISNDIAKYCLPESYKTELTWTINMRSLQNFLSLRSDKSALWEIRKLTNEIYNALPEDHRYMFDGCMKTIEHGEQHLKNLKILNEVKKEEQTEIALTDQIRFEHRLEFGLDGAYDSDYQILKWWKEKKAEEFTKHM